MSKEQGYNGWANYETWLVKLWMDNDRTVYEAVHDWWQDAKDVHELAEWIEEDIRHTSAPAISGLYADLLNAAMSSVNWKEIAQSYMEEMSDTE